jgi:WhiB family redox-sensing transcriptional regulator
MAQQSGTLQLPIRAPGVPVDLTDPFAEWLTSPGAPQLEELTRHPTWLERASCRGEPLDVFFPGENGEYVRARAVCGICPVRAECLDYALTPPRERHGFWGGATERERQRMRRRAA